jgi:DNA polymerase-3 subunit beta
MPAELLRVLTGMKGAVTISCENQQFVLTQPTPRGDRRYTLDSLPPETFPQMPETSMVDLDLAAGVLLEGISRVKYAAAKLDSRFYLNGVFIGRDMIAATNGHRAAIVSLAQTLVMEMIIPVACIPGVLAALAREDVRAQVATNIDTTATSLCIFNAESSYTCKLIDAHYPNIKQIIPPGKPLSKIEFNCADAVPVLARALVLEKDSLSKGRVSPVHIIIDKKQLRLNGKHMDDFIDCTASQEAATAMDSNYLADVVLLGKDGDLKFDFFGAGAACLLTLRDAEQHIIMPVRMSS